MAFSAVLVSAGVAGAQQPASDAATDGRRLSGESAATQASFRAVWGDRAAQEWVVEHNAQIARPAAAAPAPTPTTLPAITANTSRVDLHKVVIPPIEGKTLSADILDIDQAAHRLYVTDRTDTGIDIFDISTPEARYVTTVDVGSGPNGIQVLTDLKKVVTGLNNSTVAIIDVDPASPTFDQVVAQLDTAGKKRANELDYDPRTHKVYMENSDEGFVTVIDAMNDAIVKRIDVPSDLLEQPRFNPNDGMMYLTGSNDNVLYQFDTTRDEIVNTFHIGDDCNPNGLALNRSTNQAIFDCSSKTNQHIAVWDFNKMQVIATFDQAGAGDAAIYSAKVDRFFSTAANFYRGGQMAILSGSPVRFLTNVPTAVGSHGVAFDETNNIIYTQDQRPNQGSLFAIPLPNLQP
ncbi:MAG: hypothetical protein LC797_08190 [Chloroflexi bacterium]|nr:hypothetical protein [Chloroflexota bacterium]